ncbi:unnamed protein product [Leuciscus chuanchicus]
MGPPAVLEYRPFCDSPDHTDGQWVSFSAVKRFLLVVNKNKAKKTLESVCVTDLQQGKDSSGTSQGKESSGTSQGKDSSGTSQGKDSSGTSQGKDSSGTSQGKDSSGTSQGKDSSGTSQGKDSSGTSQGKDNSGTSQGWCVKSSDQRNLPPARPLTVHTLPIQNVPKELIPGQAMNYSNPIYSKMYHDGQHCRKPVIHLDMRRDLLPKRLDTTIRETAA